MTKMSEFNKNLNYIFLAVYLTTGEIMSLKFIIILI